MRTLITVVLLLLISQLVAAQNNFEGEIVYRTIKPSETREDLYDTATITAYFGTNKIKVVLNDPEKFNNEKYSAALLDFGRNILYLVNLNKKEFKTEKLNSFSTKQNPLLPIPRFNKPILNIPSSAFTNNENIQAGDKPYNIYWYGNTLFYSFGKINPAQFLLRRLGNGKTICLGQKEMTGEGGKDYNFFYEAISIKPTTLNDSIFAFPSNFSVEVVSGKIRKSEAISDTVNTVPKHKRKSSKKSPSKNTHNQPTKSSAIKPKD